MQRNIKNLHLEFERYLGIELMPEEARVINALESSRLRRHNPPFLLLVYNQLRISLILDEYLRYRWETNRDGRDFIGQIETIDYPDWNPLAIRHSLFRRNMLSHRYLPDLLIYIVTIPRSEFEAGKHGPATDGHIVRLHSLTNLTIRTQHCPPALPPQPAKRTTKSATNPRKTPVPAHTRTPRTTAPKNSRPGADTPESHPQTPYTTKNTHHRKLHPNTPAPALKRRTQLQQPPIGETHVTTPPAPALTRKKPASVGGHCKVARGLAPRNT